jgi:hemerythrin-like metal-binding protein
MAPLEWKDSYSVGVPELDNDHRQLIDIINRIDDAGRHGIPLDHVLYDLTHYARSHFEREEDRLRAVGYPDLDDHFAEHQSFVEWLRGVEQSLPGATAGHGEIADSLAGYLRNWLINHILVVDMRYRDFLS